LIEKTTSIEDIVNDYPELVKPLMKLGIVCIACGEPVWGTLEEQIREKGINNIDDIIEQLNKLIRR